MKRNIFKWLAVIFILLVLLVVRVVKRTYTFKSQPFKNKKLVQIEFKDLENRDVLIKKEKEGWSLFVSTKPYPVDKNRIDELAEKIDKFQLTETVTKDPKKYSEYKVDNDSATIVKIYFEKAKFPYVVYFGKIGGFSFSESYVRLNNNPQVYIAKGLTSFNFKTNFYDFCDKTVLKDNNIEEDINTILIKYQSKTINLKKELKENTTYWIDVNTNKKVDVSKVNSFFLILKNFYSDIIIDEKEVDLSKSKVDFEIKLQASLESYVDICFYKEYRKNEIPLYPVKIKAFNVSSYIEAVGKEDVIYGSYKYKYDDFTQRISDLK